MIEAKRYQFVSKDESINVSDIAAGIELMLVDKCHIDSGKEEILMAIARQIFSHRAAGCQDFAFSREVHYWAQVLHQFFFVENVRNKEREISLKTIETELFKLVSGLSSK